MINLKKLFAAAMSLAMVVTVMPVDAVSVNVKVCTTAEKDKANAYADVMYDLVDAIEDVTTLEEVRHDTKIVWNNEEVTVKAVLDADVDGETFGDKLVYNVAECGTEEDAEVAALLAGLEAGIKRIESLVAKYVADGYDDTEDANGDEMGYLTADFIDNVLAGTLTKAEQYLENMASRLDKLTNAKTTPELAWLTNTNDTTEANYDMLVEDMEEAIETVADAFDIELGKEYVTTLVAKLDTLGYIDTYKVNELTTAKTVKETIAWTKTTTKTIEKLIADIEKDKLAGVKGSYEDHEDLDEVVEIMEGLEALVEYSEALDELVEEFKDLALNEKLGRAKATLDEAKTITGTTYTKNNKWLDVFADVDDVKDLYDAINAAEFEMLVDFMELVAEFRTVSYEQVRKNWKPVVDETEYNVNFVAVVEEAKLEDLLPLVALLEDQYVPATGATELTEWDALVDYMAWVEEAYEAMTDGIKGITVNNLTAKNVEKVIAANEALKDFNFGNVTAKEEDAVNKEYIGVLYLKALFGGATTEKVTGWVDLGNGNWDYYGEDGNIFTGWVAAGTNWYYVSNGHMLRNTWIAKDATGAVWYYVGNDGAMVANTVVDGYAINANGEWVK